MKIRSILQFIKSVIIHKYYVFKLGRKYFNLSYIQLLKHDMSKFSSIEFTKYVKKFYSDDNDNDNFKYAWLHHQNHNPHHWEYWISRSGNKCKSLESIDILDMPDKYVQEMIVDWFAASIVYNKGLPKENESWKWFNNNFKNIYFSPETLRKVYAYFIMLSKLFDELKFLDKCTNKIIIDSKYKSDYEIY